MTSLFTPIVKKLTVKAILLAFASIGVAYFLSSCSTPSQRHDARVDARVDQRVDRRYERRGWN